MHRQLASNTASSEQADVAAANQKHQHLRLSCAYLPASPSALTRAQRPRPRLLDLPLEGSGEMRREHVMGVLLLWACEAFVAQARANKRMQLPCSRNRTMKLLTR